MSVPLRVYSDFICPFCYIAETSPLARLVKEYDVAVDWRGFELHPETPAGGCRLSDLFPESRLEGMRKFLADYAAGFGIAISQNPQLPNTRRILAAAEHARDGGRLEAFRPAAFKAYWEEKADLESDAVIGRVAREAGLDPEAAVRAAGDPAFLARVDAVRREAQLEGISAVPSFLWKGERLVGCETFEVLAEAAERAGARKREA